MAEELDEAEQEETAVIHARVLVWKLGQLELLRPTGGRGRGSVSQRSKGVTGHGHLLVKIEVGTLPLVCLCPTPSLAAPLGHLKTPFSLQVLAHGAEDVVRHVGAYIQ